MSYDFVRIYEIEKKYIETHTSCSAAEKRKFDQLIQGRDDEWINREYRQLFQEKIRADTQHTISCFIEHYRSGSDGTPYSDIITQLKTIKSGSYGKVSAAVNEDTITFAIKKTKKEENKDYPDAEIIHEGFVGLSALNELRRFTPGFIFTYGVSSCRDSLDLDKNISVWCNKGRHGHNFLFMENISNAISLDVVLQDTILDGASLVNFLLQIFSALNLASTTTGFTHWDLHAGNVLIQEVPQTVAVPIYLQGSKKYLLTNYLCRIIDYGASSVVNNGNFYYIQNKDIVNYPAVYPARDFSTVMYGAITYFSQNEAKTVKKYRTEINKLLRGNKEMAYDEALTAENENLVQKLQQQLEVYRINVRNLLNMLIHLYQRLGRDYLEDDKLRDVVFSKASKKYGKKLETFFNGYLLYNPKYTNLTWHDFTTWLLEACYQFQVPLPALYDEDKKNLLSQNGILFTAN